MRTTRILSVIAIVVSMLTLIVSALLLANVEQVGRNTDYLSVVISSMTLLVSVLIGFQIVNIVQLDKKFDRFKERIDLEINVMFRDYQNQVSCSTKKAEYAALGTALMMLAWSFEEKGEFDDALRTNINSLRSLQQADQSDAEIIEAIREVENAMIRISKNETQSEWIFRGIDEKNVYIDTIMKIQDRDRMNLLLRFFYSFKVLP